MRCISCPSDKQMKAERITTKYKEGGLENVILIGVEHFRCTSCGEEYFGYGDVEQLNRLITSLLIEKPELSGKEARFLRVQLGYSSAMFAEKVGVRKETLSRYENGKPIPVQFQIMLKALAASSLPYRDYDLHNAILARKGRDFPEFRLEPRRGEWTLKKTA